PRLQFDRADAGAADRRPGAVVLRLARDLLGAGRHRRDRLDLRLPAPAGDAAAGIPPAAPSRLGDPPIWRAGASSRLHGLRADRRLPVRRAVLLPVGLTVRVHRALRPRAAPLRPVLRLPGGVPDRGSLTNARFVPR